MIEAFQYIQNIGRYEQVQGRTETTLAPLTLLYSENARGKTTLCAILRSLTTGDPTPILERHRLSATSDPGAVLQIEGNTVSFDGSVWTSPGPGIVVFDDHFVDSNVHSGLSVGADHRKGVHELAVGEKGVRLQRQVQQLTDGISTLQSELREKERAIPAAALGSMSVDAFCALGPIENLSEELESASRSLVVLRDAEAIRRAREFRPFSLPAIDMDEFCELLTASLPDLEASAVAAVKQHLTGLGAGAERWAADGLSYLGEEESCPLCGQDVSGSSLIAHYRAYFSDAYAAHKRRIQEARNRLRTDLSGDRLARFQRTLHEEKEKREFWAHYVEVPDFTVNLDELATGWSGLRDGLLAAMEAKAAAPLEPVAVSAEVLEATRRYAELADRVQALGESLLGCNSSAMQTKEHADEGSTAAAQQRFDRLQAIQRRFQPDIDAACAEYLRVKSEKAAAEREKVDARTALDTHRAQVFETYQVGINRYLDTLNADFTVEGLEPSDRRGVPSAMYVVCVNGRAVGLTPQRDARPSFGTALSAGDRNTLALAFFFASLERLDLSDTIVVIDDPISSLDEARAFATSQEIRRLEGRCRQLIVLSHSRTLLCQLWEKMDKNRTATLEIRDCGRDRSTLEPWDAEAAAVTEFDRLHRLIRDYAEESRGDPQKVAPALRIMLESFIRVAFITHFKPGNQLGNFLTRAKQALADGSPILSAEVVQELDDLREYANLFHHSTNRSGWIQALANVNERELRGFAKRVVQFTTLDGRVTMVVSPGSSATTQSADARPAR